MTIGNINKLMQDRVASFTQQTAEIVSKFSDRLVPAFQKIYNTGDRAIVFTGVDSITGTDKAVMITGNMALEIGETIQIGDKSITLDETNVNEYNKMVKFAFPIIMLELATADELVEHMQRVSKIGAAMNVSSESLAKILDKIAADYEEKVLNDPAKIEIFDAATKPEFVLGFKATDLSDEHIRKLKLIEKMDLGSVN